MRGSQGSSGGWGSIHSLTYLCERYCQSNSQTEVFNIQPPHKTVTLLDLLNETRKRMGDHKYFSYNAFTNNCQDFIKQLIDSRMMHHERRCNRSING